MGCITVAHYIDIFGELGILYGDDKYEHYSIVDATIKYVKDFMYFFLSLSIAMPDFSLSAPSVQAAAIVLSARKASHIVYEYTIHVQ